MSNGGPKALQRDQPFGMTSGSHTRRTRTFGGGCPEFEYDNHPQRDALVQRCAAIAAELRRGALDSRTNSLDSRPIHGRMFEGLTPDRFPVYAGHYRGEDYDCLRAYPVGIPSDSLVGAPPTSVSYYMNLLAQEIARGIAAIDSTAGAPDVSRVRQLQIAVAFMCRIFVQLLTIHPYANGNGHAARFVSLAILGRYGFWPRSWPIEPRPSLGDYSDAIAGYRRGDTERLERLILTSCF